MIDILLIYFSGYLLSLIVLFLDNRYECTDEGVPITLGKALRYSSLSWLMVCVLFIVGVSNLTIIHKLDIWFQGEVDELPR